MEIHKSTIQVELRSLGFHKTSQTSNGFLTIPWGIPSIIWMTYYFSSHYNPSGNFLVTSIGVHHQHPQISLNTLPDGAISQVRDQLGICSIPCSREETCSYPQGTL